MKKILISGASFAGLSTAFWMNKLGYKVTIVEISQALKKGGTPVNILAGTIDTVKRSPETNTYLTQINKVLAWAKNKSWYTPDFMESLKKTCEQRGTLSPKQAAALSAHMAKLKIR